MKYRTIAARYNFRIISAIRHVNIFRVPFSITDEKLRDRDRVTLNRVVYVYADLIGTNRDSSILAKFDISAP